MDFGDQRFWNRDNDYGGWNPQHQDRPRTVLSTSTTILTQNTNSALFAFSAVPFGQLMRYSLMSISPKQASRNEFPSKPGNLHEASGCPNIRVDNITFGAGYVNDPAQAYSTSNNMFGVYDHDTWNGPGTGIGAASVQISFSAWKGIGDSGDESYFDADSTGTANALFQENNIYNGARGSENDVGFNGLGGDRYVNRYNVSNNTPGTGFFSSHGTAWTGRDRGSRQKEVYRNQINCSSAVGSCGGGNFPRRRKRLCFREYFCRDWNRLLQPISKYRFSPRVACCRSLAVLLRCGTL